LYRSGPAVIVKDLAVEAEKRKDAAGLSRWRGGLTRTRDGGCRKREKKGESVEKEVDAQKVPMKKDEEMPDWGKR